MNIGQKLESRLVGMGMSDSQSKEVISLAKPDLEKTIDGYGITLSMDSDSYPEGIYNAIMICVKPVALKWINANKPQAWFKPMFE